jgi:hypothetical protein
MEDAILIAASFFFSEIGRKMVEISAFVSRLNRSQEWTRRGRRLAYEHVVLVVLVVLGLLR